MQPAMTSGVDYYDMLGFVVNELEMGLIAFEKLHTLSTFAVLGNFGVSGFYAPLHAGNVQRAVNHLERVSAETGVRLPVLALMDDENWWRDVNQSLKMFDVMFSRHFFHYMHSLLNLIEDADSNGLIDEVAKRMDSENENDMKKEWDKFWQEGNEPGYGVFSARLWEETGKYFSWILPRFKKSIVEMHRYGLCKNVIANGF